MASNNLPLPDFRPLSPLPHELTRSQISTAISNSSRTLLNRLRSIHNDSHFPLAVHEAFHGRLPLVVNKRAGEWYVPPSKRAGSVYFKSTDGHTGNWGFSLRRLNLNLLEIIERGGGEGAIIVDSTRRGKRYPDSLSKTIPIWCSVLNSVLFPTTQPPNLFTPPQAISPQENHYINSLIPSFVSSFLSLSVNLPLLTMLKKPIRPFFITPDDYFLPDIDPTDTSTPLIFEDYTPLVLISASRVVKNSGLEGEYIQGAGDDAENWLKSVDLDPTFFWAHNEAILACQSDDEAIAHVRLLRQSINTVAAPVKICPVSPDESLSILLTPSAKGQAYPMQSSGEPYDIVIDVSSDVQDRGNPDTAGGYLQAINPSSIHTHTHTHTHTLRESDVSESLIFRDVMKKGKPAKALRDNILPKLLDFLTQPARRSPATILVVSDNPADISVAIALFVLCLWYSGTGAQHVPDSLPPAGIDKGYIRQRLAWITAIMGEHLSPSRPNLNAVNAILMQHSE